MHFISIIITSAPPQIIRHYILEAGDPCSKTLTEHLTNAFPPFRVTYKHYSEKAMAPHSSTLAWKIPWTEGLVGCSPVQKEFTLAP